MKKVFLAVVALGFCYILINGVPAYAMMEDKTMMEDKKASQRELASLKEQLRAAQTSRDSRKIAELQAKIKLYLPDEKQRSM